MISLHGGHPDHTTLWLYSDPRLSQLLDSRIREGTTQGSDSWRYQDQ